MEPTIYSWFDGLLSEWERAWNEAGSTLRDDVANSLCCLLPPLQGHLYISKITSPPLETATLLLVRDPERPHGELRILASIDSGAWSGDAPDNAWAMQGASVSLSNMHDNWIPDRHDSMPLHRAIWMQRMDGKVPCTSWLVPGDITRIDVRALIAEQFEHRANPHQPAPRVEDKRTHIAELHRTREPISTTRWLSINAPDLAAALGIKQPFWCGLFLPRRELFDASLDGDIDFLAGPLEFEIDEAEWRDRLEEESRRHHIGAPRPFVVQQCRVRAAQEGLLRWPPRLEHLSGCEVKASWFDSEGGVWRASHVREGPRVKGQLKLLLRFGLDRVGFLHLGTTSARVVATVNPWFLAGHDAERARKKLPLLFPPDEMAECGYFQAVIGSVPFACEDLSGAGGALIIRQESPARACTVQNWREELFNKLSELLKPRSLQTVIRACQSCGHWQVISTLGTSACVGCGMVFDSDEETSAPLEA